MIPNQGIFSPSRYFLLLITVWLGVGLCIHLYLQEQVGFSRGCLGLGGGKTETASGGWVDCALVSAANPLAEFGVSLATVGFFYWSILLLGLTSLRGMPSSPGGWRALRLYTLTGTLISGGLVGWMFVVTGKGCPLCLIDAVLALQSCGLTLWPKRGGSKTGATSGSAKDPGGAVPAIHLGGVLGLILILVWINGVGRPTPNGIDQRAFYELLEGAIAPFYLDEMAPCGFGRNAAVPEGWAALAEDMGIDLPGEEGPVEWVYFYNPGCPGCADFESSRIWTMEVLAGAQAAGLVRHTARPVLLSRSFDEATTLLEAMWETEIYAELKLMIFSFQQDPDALKGEALRALLEKLTGDPNGYPSSASLAAARERLEKRTIRVQEAGVQSLPSIFINGLPLAPSRRNTTVQCLLTLIREAAGAEVVLHQTWDGEAN